MSIEMDECTAIQDRAAYIVELIGKTKNKEQLEQQLIKSLASWQNQDFLGSL